MPEGRNPFGVTRADFSDSLWAMSLYQLLPTTLEAVARLAQTRERGCLVVFNSQEAVHLFVQGGFIVYASGKKQGAPAVDQALKMPGSSYGWIQGAEPASKDIHVEIRHYLLDNSLAQDPGAAGKTIKIPPSGETTESKASFNYYFVPEDAPTVQVKVKKISNVVGRDATCDIILDNFQVSRRHCILQLTERGLLVKDLESTNGTFVNGIPMKDGYINDGNRLSLGTYVLTLYREKV